MSEIRESNPTPALIKRARERIHRRMADFGPFHRLTIEATKLSMRLQERLGLETAI